MTLPSFRKTLLLFLCSAVSFGACRLPEPPVSKEEALTLAHRIEHSTAKHDSTLLNRIFDEKALAQHVSDAGGFFLSRTLIASAIKGFTGGGLGTKVVQAIGSDGSYQLVKQYEKEGRQHILFRFYSNNGVNYYDFELVKRDEGIKADDMYVYTSGENISKTLADALKRLNTGSANKDLQTINQLNALLDQGHYEEANTEFEKLPADLKRQKGYQMVRVRIFSHFGNDRYIEALRDYRSLFPHDPNMYLLMIDAYILQKDYPGALDAVNKLDSIINKDPFQDYERGLIYKLMNDTANERICLERLHKNMPDFVKGTWELISLYHSMNQFDKSVALIKEMSDTTK